MCLKIFQAFLCNKNGIKLLPTLHKQTKFQFPLIDFIRFHEIWKLATCFINVMTQFGIFWVNFHYFFANIFYYIFKKQEKFCKVGRGWK